MNKFNIALKIKAKNGILQQFIDEKGWTQSDLARALDVCPTTIGRWFNMQDFPRSPEIIDKICNLTKMLLEDIFPDFLKNPEFLATTKQWILHREVDLEFLPFNKIPEIAYMPDFDGFELPEKINEVLATLTPREEKIIKLRFGIDGLEGKDNTLEEVAHQMGITRERVRQIEIKALRKMKHPKRLEELREHMDD